MMKQSNKNITKTFDELISSVMPQLSSEEHDALQRDIEYRGIQVPIIVDQDGNVIDGRNRSAIAKKLKKNVKKTVIKFRNDDDRLRYAMSVNLKRRHLSSEQYRELAKKLKKLKWTQQDIADITGVPRRTISDWLSSKKDSENTTNGETAKGCNFYDIRLKLPENADDIILERVKRGDTEEEIATDFKEHQSTIYA